MKQECYGIGTKICNALKAPKTEHAKRPSELFPSSSAVIKRSNPAAFDPQADCVVFLSQQKKKSTKIQPKNITAVVIDGNSFHVPRGQKRMKLKEKGCIQIISVKLSMSAL